MQGLSAAQHRRHGLYGGADNVVFRLLRGQRGTSRLGVEAQHHGARIAGLETLFHGSRPHASGRAILGYLFQKIVMRIKEEGKTRRKVVHVQPGMNGGFNVGNGIGQSECNFLHGSAAGLAHVVSGNRNRVPFR